MFIHCLSKNNIYFYTSYIITGSNLIKVLYFSDVRSLKLRGTMATYLPQITRHVIEFALFIKVAWSVYFASFQ
jgi:hypothetical protein